MTRVTINGVEYNYQLDFAALLHYERLCTLFKDPSPNLKSALMHFACLLSDPTFTMSFDEFTMSVTSAKALNTLNEAMNSESARWESREECEAKNNASKKK